jgi:hypothetical protein
MGKAGLHIAILCALIAAVFVQTYAFDFLNFDDNAYILTNPHVLGGLTPDNIKWAFTGSLVGHWHPLSWMSHMLDIELFGLQPGPFHLMNVGFHLLNTILVYVLLLRLTVGAWPAFFLAAIFGIHPLRIESVVWISERKDVLALFFSLVTIHFYLAYCAQRTVARFLPVVIAQTLALLAKPSAVVLPLLLFTLDYWPLRRAVFSRAVLLEKLPLVVLVVGSSLATLWAQSGAGAMPSMDTIPMGARISVAMVSWMTYFGKLIIPTALGIFYPMVNYAPGIASGAAISLAIISAICFSQRGARPYLLCGWLWFLAASLPVVGFVSVGGQAFADRWTYLPHIGLLIALGGYCGEINNRARQGIVFASGLVLVSAYGALALKELPNWKNSEAVFRRTLEVSPQNFMAHTNLGTVLTDKGLWDEAALHYEEAYRLNPTYPEAINNLGTLRAHQKRYPEALVLFEKAVRIRPDFKQANDNLALARRLTNNVCSVGICNQ